MTKLKIKFDPGYYTMVQYNNWKQLPVIIPWYNNSYYTIITGNGSRLPYLPYGSDKNFFTKHNFKA